MNTQTKQIPFTIENYQELVVKAGSHQVELVENGKLITGEIIDTNYFIAGVQKIIFKDQTENGNHSLRRAEMNGEVHSAAHLIIVPNPPKSLGWFNFYERSSFGPYESRQEADRVHELTARHNTIRLAIQEIFQQL